MSEHPWPSASLGSLLYVFGGGTPSTEVSANWGGDIPWATSADLSDQGEITPRKFITAKGLESSPTNVVPAGSVVVATRVGLGKVALAREAMAFSQDCQGLVFDNSKLDPRFVCHQMRWIARSFQAVSRGTTISGITKNQLVASNFHVTSFREQQRTADKLDELFSYLDAGVASLHRAQANLKRYRTSLLKAAVEGRLTADWRQKERPSETGTQLLARLIRERRLRWEEAQLTKYEASGKAPPKDWREKYVEPLPPDATKLPTLPASWCWATFDQCFRVRVGATPSRAQPLYWQGDIPWVSSGEVRFCEIYETREAITASGLQGSSTQLNPAGSVLLGMIGEGKTRGQAAILRIPACNNQNCAAIWVSETDVLPEYVYAWLTSQYEATRRAGSGNNQPALNKSLVEAMYFPLPPLCEQARIVERVDAAMSSVLHAEQEAKNAFRRAASLRQAILKHAFAGKLVAQDPDDEPAAVLLERIRAARAAAPARTMRARATGKAPARAAKKAASAAKPPALDAKRPRSRPRRSKV